MESITERGDFKREEILRGGRTQKKVLEKRPIAKSNGAVAKADAKKREKRNTNELRNCLYKGKD